jgi:hypothetical protein
MPLPSSVIRSGGGASDDSGGESGLSLRRSLLPSRLSIRFISAPGSVSLGEIDEPCDERCARQTDFGTQRYFVKVRETRRHWSHLSAVVTERFRVTSWKILGRLSPCRESRRQAESVAAVVRNRVSAARTAAASVVAQNGGSDARR